MDTDRSAVSVGTYMGWGFVTLMVGVSWVGNLVQAGEQSVGESSTSEAIGKPVRNPDGSTLGRIQDIVISWRRDGYSEYAVLSVSEHSLWKEEHIGVPWVELTASKHKNYYIWNRKVNGRKDASAVMAYHFYDPLPALSSEPAGRGLDRRTSAYERL